jgi:hypothetical protein
VAAAKVVLSYAIGKPAEAPNPDRLDVEEWQGFNESCSYCSNVGHVFALWGLPSGTNLQAI